MSTIPAEYPKLLQPLIDNHADVVYGSRFLSTGPHRVLYFWHYVGNKALTLLSNIFTNHNLTDMETGYKVFRKSIIDKITIEEKRFGFEPEITAKVSKIKDVRVYEVGISYFGRTYAEGKNIGWRDGIRALICIIKYNLRLSQVNIRMTFSFSGIIQQFTAFCKKHRRITLHYRCCSICITRSNSLLS